MCGGREDGSITRSAPLCRRIFEKKVDLKHLPEASEEERGLCRRLGDDAGAKVRVERGLCFFKKGVDFFLKVPYNAKFN